MTRTSRRYNLFSATLAAVVWGGWSYVVNSAESTSAGVVSGLAQSIASFTLTLVVVQAVTWIYNAISHRLLQIIVPAIVMVTCVGTLLVAVHSLVGTPHIVFTIAPSLTVAFVFCLVTACTLRNAETSSQA